MNVEEISYGVTEYFKVEDELDEKVLELSINGYTTLESRIPESKLDEMGQRLENLYLNQRNRLGEDLLISINDANTVRSPLSEDEIFREVALNNNLRDLAERYLKTDVMLLQQNGLINRKAKGNPQGKFHRDLAYQHWISSRPLAINALLAIDDFTDQNGATWVIPSSHHIEVFPSENFINTFKKQILVPRGNFMILDAMLFHAAGTNLIDSKRRALNHVIGRPFMSQQIDISSAMTHHNQSIEKLKSSDLKYLGFYWRSGENSDTWRREKANRK
jgi:hypothetical protein